MAPEDIIDYIVVHELVHLKEKNHTKRFWNLIEKHIPGYNEKVEWLDKNSTELIFTKNDL